MAQTNLLVQYDLSSYLSLTRQYLNDPNAQFWSDASLTLYINQARQHLAIEGGTTLTYLDFPTYGLTLTPGQEIFPFPTVNVRGALRQIMVIEDITLLWGAIVYPLQYRPFGEYLAIRRIDPSVLRTIPLYWTQNRDEGQYFIYPTPGWEDIGVEIRGRFWPLPMPPSGADVDIIQPFQDLVPVLASIVASYNQREYEHVRTLAALYQTMYSARTNRQSRLITQYLAV